MGILLDFDEQEGRWVTYPEATDEEYKIRPLTSNLVKHWNTLTTKKRWRRGQEVPEQDEDRLDELWWDHLIEDWRGAIYFNREQAERKEPAPCTLENKLKFRNKQAIRAGWIIQIAQELGDYDEKRRDEQRQTFRGEAQVSA
jgi:hypothetical protein